MNKIIGFIAKLCIVFGFFNILDLYFTLNHIEWEVNPLVLNNFGLFYMIKFITSILLITIGWYKHDKKTY